MKFYYRATITILLSLSLNAMEDEPLSEMSPCEDDFHQEVSSVVKDPEVDETPKLVKESSASLSITPENEKILDIIEFCEKENSNKLKDKRKFNYAFKKNAQCNKKNTEINSVKRFQTTRVTFLITDNNKENFRTNPRKKKKSVIPKKKLIGKNDELEDDIEDWDDEPKHKAKQKNSKKLKTSHDKKQREHNKKSSKR